MLRPLPTEPHSSTIGSVQRCSHRRVAAYACGTCAASRSCPPRPRPGNADFSIHDPRAVEREPGSWEGAAISFSTRAWSFLSAIRLFCWRRGFAGRAGTSCHLTSLLSSSRRCRSRRPRSHLKSQGCSAIQKPGREGILLTAGATLW